MSLLTVISRVFRAFFSPKTVVAAAGSPRNRLLGLTLAALPGLVFLAGLGLTELLWVLAQRDAERALREEFDFRTNEGGSRIESRMKSYEQLLRDAAALATLHPDLSHDDFHDYVSRMGIERNFPGTQGVGYLLAVHPADIPAHLAFASRQGLKTYTIRPPGERALMSPVLYLEPDSGLNLRVIGYDLLSEPVRRLSLERARDEAITTISGRVTLIQDLGGPPQAGVLMASPVYARGKDLATIAERRANLVGWMAAPLRLKDLLAGILGHQYGDLNEAISLSIFDGDASSADSLLFETDPNGASAMKPPLFQSSRTLTVGGRNWRVAFVSRPPFDARLGDGGRLQWIAWAGTAGAALLAVILWLLIHGRARAWAYATRMTDELRQAVGWAEAMATDLGRSRAALAEKATALEQRNQDLEQFTEVLAHHLQEPVRQQYGFTQRLERQLPKPLAPELQQSMDFVTKGAVRLRALLHDVQLYLSVSQLPPPTRSCRAGTALDLALDRLGDRLAETTVEFAPDPLPACRIEPHRLADVFFAVIENSIHHAQPDLAPHVRVACEQRECDTVLTLTDNGIGIPAQYHSRVFRVFERLAPDDRKTGTGIGLAMAKKIIESARGRIWIESPEAGGTRICITLPPGDE